MHDARRVVCLDKGNMKRATFFVLALLPAVLTVRLITTCAIDFPFWDQWFPSIAGVLIKANQHTLTLGDLFSQHNEHRFFVPRLIYIPLAWLTHWSIYAELTVEFLIVLVTSFGILRLICVTAYETPTTAMDWRICFLWFLCNVLIMSVMQFENWLLGVGVANVLPGFFIVLALCLLTYNLSIWTQTVAVILCSFLATYSSGNGMLCWPIATAMLAVPYTLQHLKARFLPLAAIGIASLVLVGLYFAGYARPTSSPAIELHPLRSLAYFVTFVGNNFSFSAQYSPVVVASMIGSIMLLLLGAITVLGGRLLFLQRDERAAFRIHVWVLIASYAILSGAMASITREGLGIIQAISSRYTTFALFLPVAMINLVWICAHIANRRQESLPLAVSHRLQWIVQRMPVILSTLLLTLIFQRINPAFRSAQDYRNELLKVRNMMLLCRLLPDQPVLSELSTGAPGKVIETARTLDQLGYLRPRLIANADISTIATPIEASGIVGQHVRAWAPSPGTVATSGWARFGDRPAAEYMVLVTCDDAAGHPIIVALAENGLPIRDVVSNPSGDPEQRSGWIATFPQSRFPKGIASVALATWVYVPETNLAYKLNSQAPPSQ